MLNYLTLQYYFRMTSFCEFMISQMNISRKDEYLTNFTIINKEIKHKVNKIQPFVRKRKILNISLIVFFFAFNKKNISLIVV